MNISNRGEVVRADNAKELRKNCVPKVTIATRPLRNQAKFGLDIEKGANFSHSSCSTQNNTTRSKGNVVEKWRESDKGEIGRYTTWRTLFL